MKTTEWTVEEKVFGKNDIHAFALGIIAFWSVLFHLMLGGLWFLGITPFIFYAIWKIFQPNTSIFKWKYKGWEGTE